MSAQLQRHQKHGRAGHARGLVTGMSAQIIVYTDACAIKYAATKEDKRYTRLPVLHDYSCCLVDTRTNTEATTQTSLGKKTGLLPVKP